MEFKNKIVYEVYIKSFKDSKGDGIGDFKGIIERIPYLKSLNVNCIWLTPFYLSPMVDEGYDVSNYKKINPEFGNFQDLENLINICNKNGIDIMADFVLNHTSSEHDWFKKAISGDEFYQNFYFFFDKPKTKWISRFDEECWEYVPKINKYYLHLYHKNQPDLNWDNPIVRKKMFKIVDFWLKKGIKAYKFDVLYLISKPTYNNWEPSGKIKCTDAVADGKYVHKYIKEFIKKIKEKFPNTYSVGEMSFSSMEECVNYSLQENKEMDIVQTGQILTKSPPKKHPLNQFDKNETDTRFYIENIKKWINYISKKGGWICNFTSNHDQPRSVNSLGSIKYWEKSAKMLNMYLATCWGTPFYIQGDEIGMLNPDYKKAEHYIDIKSKTIFNWAKEKNFSMDKMFELVKKYGRDAGRNPMILNETKNGGFSDSDSTWRKIPEWLIKKVNVEKQEKDDNSILNNFREMNKLRLKHKSFYKGDIVFTNYNEYVLSYKRDFENESFECLFNFSDNEVKVKSKYNYKKMIKSNYLVNNSNDSFVLLRPWEGIIYKK